MLWVKDILFSTEYVTTDGDIHSFFVLHKQF